MQIPDPSDLRSAYVPTSFRGVKNQAGWEGPIAGGAACRRGESGDEREAETTVTRGTGFTSPFPPPAPPPGERNAVCSLVGLMRARFFTLHKEWAGVQSARRNSSKFSPALFPRGCGRIRGGTRSASSAFSYGLKKQTVF